MAATTSRWRRMGASERAYAAYLIGNWSGLDPALLPEHHRVLLANANKPAQASSVLTGLEDPLARLVAAGVLLQTGRLSAADITVATDTASSQGWRRPLLAWLNVQLQRANEAGDRGAAARIQRRIDSVQADPSKISEQRASLSGQFPPSSGADKSRRTGRHTS